MANRNSIGIVYSEASPTDYFLRTGYVVFSNTFFALLNYAVSAKIKHEPVYAFHYRNNIDVDLVYLIMREFVAKVNENNQRPLITIIPSCRDLEYFSSKDIFPYFTLVKKLKENNIEYIDFGDAMKNRDDFSRFHSWFGSCTGHFNELGYKVMSEEFVKYIQLKTSAS